MTPVQFSSYVRIKTKTNSSTFSDANMLLLMNVFKDEIAAMIVDKVDEDYFGAPQTADLVNGQREYPLPTDLPGKLKKVEAVLDPTYLDTKGNPVWVALNKFDLTQYSQLSQNLVAGDSEQSSFGVAPTTDEDTIQSLFGNRQGEAAWMLYRNSIWIFSGALTGFATRNDYLKLWGYQWPADIQSLAGTAGLEIDPDNQDAALPRQLHLSWADMVVKSWNESTDKEYKPTDYERGIEERLEEAIERLKQVDKDESFTATMPSAGHLYNDGYNL